jgi:hypothetical protein
MTAMVLAPLDEPGMRFARAVVAGLIGRGEPAALLADEPVPWPALLATGRRHKLLSHMAWALSRGLVPAGAVTDDGLARFDEHRRRSARSMLGAVAQTAEALGTLSDAGIPAITVKGPGLAQVLFDDPTVRGVGDVDIIVSPADAVAAERLLRGIGYCRTRPRVDRADGVPVRNLLASAVGLRREGSVAIDLQWRLLPRHALRAPSIVPELADATELAVAGVMLRTLPEDDHLRFASSHAIVHEWARFKWLVDFGVVARRLGTERHAALAVADGFGRQAAAGLDALDVVVGVAGGPASAPARRALARMVRPDAESPGRGAGWRYHFAMADRPVDKARVIARFGMRFMPEVVPKPPLRTNRSTRATQRGEAP